MITANAAGEIAPPLALFSFERIPSTIAAASPSHWGIGRSPNGRMTAECYYEYISNVFFPFLLEKNIPLPVIFFVDGHKSHLSLQLSEFCREKGTVLISLPLNATHILQPLDVAFFWSIKKKWKHELDLYKMKYGKALLKHDVTVLLNEILCRENFRETLKNGFRSCGLFPWDENAAHYESE